MNSISMASFNCESIKRAHQHVRELCKTNDFIALQEHWLLPHELDYINTIDAEFAYSGSSAVDTSAGPLKGRPYGGVAVLWRKTRFRNVTPLDTGSKRVAAVRVEVADRSFIVLSVYMPCDSDVNLPLFTEYLGVISAIVEGSDIECIVALGDFNANFLKKESLFARELLEYCRDQRWQCADLSVLGEDSNTFTYRSASDGTISWLDHCVVTAAAMDLITKVSVDNNVNWSDHYPLIIDFDINSVVPKINLKCNTINKILWGNRVPSQIDKYNELVINSLQFISDPNFLCTGKTCNNLEHCNLINTYYDSLVKCLSNAAIDSHRGADVKKKQQVIGWNYHVKNSHSLAKIAHNAWIFYGCPSSGPFYNNMNNTRKEFKNKLKWCQRNEDKIKMDIIAFSRHNKDFGKFWKQTNKLKYKTSLPVSVNGSHDESEIASMFIGQFKVDNLECKNCKSDCARRGAACPSQRTATPPPAGPWSPPAPLGGRVARDEPSEPESRDTQMLHVTADQVRKCVVSMKRGKSPGHDGLSIEHVLYGGSLICEKLAVLLNACIDHSYLPMNFMKTTVVPIVKNRTGDLSSLSNYRHLLTNNLKDNDDLERQRRLLAMKSNMLARTFSQCSIQVRITLFQAYCQAFYTGQLWWNYTQRAMNTLRVQYNNAFRCMLKLPWRCSASAMFATNGVKDFFALMRNLTTSFHNRIVNCNSEIIKTIFVTVYQKTTPFCGLKTNDKICKMPNQTVQFVPHSLTN
ncbi:hypothetical protein JYU34_015495 [Plutella xylostella]|uniref:Endonuclease/exonuclease/phosphatase domain-containing protein n=1 Tax=Plutella xylostella TaxID=51655 RepID=A0ABQ7Q8P1_PLUXY|nr:hypothetical protein JYU34_015495 [Plutella xylostella]